MRDNQTSQVEFSGEGSEYFKIWIANLLLSVATLGIYSAWAKVRKLKYFSNHISLDGRSLSFEADPLNILIGRLLMALIFFVMMGVEWFSPLASSLIWGALFLFVVPFAIIAGLKFRLRNTKYRGVRFNFTGTYGKAFLYYTLPYLGVMIAIFAAVAASGDSFGIIAAIVTIVGILLIPAIVYYQAVYLVNHTWFGDKAFSFTGSLSDFYSKFYVLGGLAAVSIALLISGSGGLAVIGGVMAYFVALGGWLYIRVQMRNMMFNQMSVMDITAESEMKFWTYLGINIKNNILTSLTFGLYIPFAQINIAKYKAECTRFMLTDSIDQVAQANQGKRSAIGEEAGDTLFDVDFVI